MQTQENANDSNRVMFPGTSNTCNGSYCSLEPSNDSRQLNTANQIGLVTRSSPNTNAGTNTQVQSLNAQ